jgi:hypothetical protein
VIGGTTGMVQVLLAITLTPLLLIAWVAVQRLANRGHPAGRVASDAMGDHDDAWLDGAHPHPRGAACCSFAAACANAGNACADGARHGTDEYDHSRCTGGVRPGGGRSDSAGPGNARAPAATVQRSVHAIAPTAADRRCGGAAPKEINHAPR